MKKHLLNHFISGILLTLILIKPSAGQLNLQYAYSLGSTVFENYTSLLSSSLGINGSLSITGVADSTVDLDPGPGVYKLDHCPFGLFVARYDSGGSLIFARPVVDSVFGTYPAGGPGATAVTDHIGNTFVSVYTMGPYSYTEPYSGYAFNVHDTMLIDSVHRTTIRQYIAKYAPDGKLKWLKQFTRGVEIQEMTVDKHNNLIIGGYFGDYGKTKDLDPGPDSTLYKTRWNDVFIMKMKYNGEVLFIKPVHCIASHTDYSQLYISNIKIDSKSNIYFALSGHGLYDLDPGTDTVKVRFPGYDGVMDSYLVEKLDSYGNYIFHKKFFDFGFGAKISIDRYDYVYLWTYLTEPVDIDPSSQVTIINPAHYGDKLIAKFNSKMEYKQSVLLKGQTDDYLMDLHISPNNNFFLMTLLSDSDALAPVGIPDVGHCSPAGKRVIVQMDSMFNGHYFSEISNSFDSTSYYYHLLSDSKDNLYLAGNYSGRFDADFTDSVYYVQNPFTNPIHRIPSIIISLYATPPNLRIPANDYKLPSINSQAAPQESGVGRQIYISPNDQTPASLYTLNGISQSASATLTVYSTEGKRVLQHTLKPFESTLNLLLQPGIYILIAEDHASCRPIRLVSH